MVSIKPARIVFCVGLIASAQFAGSQLGAFSTAYAQDADAAANEYSALLDQIQNVKLATLQREVMIENQKTGIEDLRTEIQTVPETKSAVRGIVTEMVAEIEKVIESDLPFREEERSARVERMRKELADETATDADIFRRAMTLYDVEANYGYTISAYTGNNPKNPGTRLAACIEDTFSAGCNLSKEQRDHMEAGGELDGIAESIKDGNYVHFGRLSFIYLQLDSSEGFRWSKESGGWEPLSAGDILNARRSVRIARGESAPGVVTAPIQVQAAQ